MLSSNFFSRYARIHRGALSYLLRLELRNKEATFTSEKVSHLHVLGSYFHFHLKFGISGINKLLHPSLSFIAQHAESKFEVAKYTG